MNAPTIINPVRDRLNLGRSLALDMIGSAPVDGWAHQIAVIMADVAHQAARDAHGDNLQAALDLCLALHSAAKAALKIEAPE